MATAESVPAPATWSWRRVRFPVIVLTVAALVVAVVRLLPGDRPDLGSRRIISVVVAAIAVLLVFLWFELFSHARGTTRLIVFLIAILALGGAAGAVRRVEFDGYMTPTVDWRWNLDRDLAVEQHRQAQAPAAGPALDQIALAPDDVLEYRGADRTGIMPGPPLARSWSPTAPKQVWRQPVGGGYAAFVTAGPLLVTIEQRRDKEAIVAYLAETGAETWVHSYETLFSEALGGDGPRATPTVVGDKVYALGAKGMLSCLELTTGKPVWAKNILADDGAKNLDWGMSGSPLVYDGLVVVNPGSQEGGADSRALVAYHADTGEIAWKQGQGKAGYASPMLATLAGKRQILSFEGNALASYDADGGAELWRTPWESDFDINAVQPVVLAEDRVLISSASGAALYQIKASDGKWSADELWKNRKLKCGYSCPIAYGDHIYGLDDGILACVELATGKQLWKGGRYGHGQMLLRGDLFVVLTEKGELALVEATPAKFTELGILPAIEGRTWNNPTLRGNRLFVRNHLEMAAFDLPLVPADDP
ncbi:MAG: PQQ-like beta-propeller repeat protein [Pirellulales bacterium]|nr:PQQ-like beta-propeller repeat protein [Pirellulales bacterium]